MPMSEREVALWQAQGNRHVRATVDSAGPARVNAVQFLAGIVGLCLILGLGTLGWVLLLSLVAP